VEFCPKFEDENLSEILGPKLIFIKLCNLRRRSKESLLRTKNIFSKILSVNFGQVFIQMFQILIRKLRNKFLYVCMYVGKDNKKELKHIYVGIGKVAVDSE
jgi:hypothetical protein